MRWRDRVEEPGCRYYRYPISRVLVKLLINTSITPNQITMIQPFLAAASGVLIARGDYASTVGAVILFEIRSVLDCTDGSLARAKNMVSDTGHAMDGFADWLSVVFLYIGIGVRFYRHPPTLESVPSWLSWSLQVPVWSILVAALLHAAFRSFASDYHLQKYGSIFSTGQDATVEALRKRLLSMPANPSFFQRFEIFIAQTGQLFFEQRLLDPEKTPADNVEVRSILAREHSSAARALAALWSVSNGDAFLSLVMISALFDQLWAGQVFWATVGPVWILAVVLLSSWFTRARSTAHASV